MTNMFRSRSSPKLHDLSSSFSGLSLTSSSSSSSSYGSWSRNYSPVLTFNKEIERTRQLIDLLQFSLKECLRLCKEYMNKHSTCIMKCKLAKEYSEKIYHQLECLALIRSNFMQNNNNNRNIINCKEMNNEIDVLLGFWNIYIESIQGWARLCMNDVYEIIIINGNGERYKSKVKIGRDSNTNEWESRQFIIKATQHDIQIRVKEIKKNGLLTTRHYTLGTKIISYLALINPNPQLITMNANHCGTVKVTIKIEWRPFYHFQFNDSL